MSKLQQTLIAIRERFPLRLQLTVVVGLLCLALVLLTATTAANVATSQASTQVKNTLHSVASGLADRLDYRMFERYREVRNLVALKPLQSAWQGDAAQIRPMLEQMQATFPQYAWIGYVDVTGQVIASTKGLLEGVSVAERPWFKKGLVEASVLDVHDAKLLAQLLEPSADGQPFRFVDVAAPVLNASGETIGVLGAHLSWAFAQAMQADLLADLPPNTATDIWILNRAGEVLAGPRFGSTPFSPQDVEQLRAGNAIVDAARDLFFAGASTKGYLDYAGLGWIIVAVQPQALAMADSNSLTHTILQVGLLLAIAGALVIALIAGRLMRPLSLLASEVDQVGREPSSTVTRIGGSQDLVALSSAVRSLLRRIGMAENATEQARRDTAGAFSLLEERTRRLGDDMNVLQGLADSDPLTGLLNRRAFNVFAEDSFSHFRRYNRAVAILIIDIDFFKRINDTLGHGTGDMVIGNIARQIAGAVRATDKVARFGGEEFVVMLDEVEAQPAIALAERIRAAIANATIDQLGSLMPVTVSIGVALINAADRDIGDVIERADRALYRAKGSGRNRVVADWPDSDAVQAA